MHLSPSDYALWSFTTLLEIVLCTLIVRFRTYRVIPFFSAYLFLAAARSLSLWWIYHDRRLEAGVVLNLYWVTQLILVVGRGLAAAEVCRLALREHRGVWGLTWRLLAGVGLALVVFAGVAVLHDTSWIAPVTLRGERGLELAIAAVLAAVVAVCRYYGIRLSAPVKLLGLGLAQFSIIKAINNSFMYAQLTNFFPMWRVIHLVSFAAALVFWYAALRKPLEATVPRLLEPESYEEMAPAVSYRLRQLNDRLLEMLK